MWWIVLIGLSTSWAAEVSKDIYAIPIKTIDGDAATLAPYRGKTLLVVNTASRCGYTRQYEALEKLHELQRDRGVVVLGFPSNDFGGQEPGSDAEIKKFCQTKFAVKFPLFAKAPVTGEHRQPLFEYLVTHAPAKGEVKWNFEKFVVSPKGEVTARFPSGVTPDAPEIEAALAAAAKTSAAR